MRLEDMDMFRCTGCRRATLNDEERRVDGDPYCPTCGLAAAQEAYAVRFREVFIDTLRKAEQELFDIADEYGLDDHCGYKDVDDASDRLQDFLHEMEELCPKPLPAIHLREYTRRTNITRKVRVIRVSPVAIYGVYDGGIDVEDWTPKEFCRSFNVD